MNPGRYFMPGMGLGPMMRMGPNFGINPLMRASSFTPRMELFSRIANGIKKFNWGGLLSGANKTLNVVNQTIPLIRQTKPMINNVKNMIHLAKAFKSETGYSSNFKQSNIVNNTSKKIIEGDNIQKKEVIDNENYPNFFI